MRLRVWHPNNEPAPVELQLAETNGKILLAAYTDEVGEWGNIVTALPNGTIFRNKGIDPRYGFGLDSEGRVVLADEPDIDAIREEGRLAAFEEAARVCDGHVKMYDGVRTSPDAGAAAVATSKHDAAEDIAAVIRACAEEPETPQTTSYAEIRRAAFEEAAKLCDASAERWSQAAQDGSAQGVFSASTAGCLADLIRELAGAKEGE